MRTKRVKIDPRIRASTTHIMSRTNNRERLFGPREMRKLLALVRQAAEFCGLEITTYALMPNHPHLFPYIPPWRQDHDDAELLRRYRVLNPKPQPTKYRSKQLDVIAAHLAANTEEGIEWRRRQLAQMGDISQFMKIVKQRFTVWFNQQHGRSGTIWGGRFKSVLVQENSGALLAMATYIDLNPVRAGMVADPKDYTFSGYAAAVAGEERARRGILRIVDLPTWDLAQCEYRKLLYATGTKAKAGKHAIPFQDFEAVVAAGGKLTLAEALRCRIRQFTDGLVLGTPEFVAEHLATFTKENKRKRPGRPRPLPAVADWGGLATLRGLRRQ